MAASQPKAERPKPDPKALTPEYHKARKQLMLWAGILFVWELVGIDLQKAKDAGGNAGALIASIKSPQAVPWVLLVLVAYFFFKSCVEWSQCEVRRRQLLAARIDFGSGWVAACLAFALYAYQAATRIQLADVVQGSPSRVLSAMVGFMLMLIIITAVRPKVLHLETSKFRLGFSIMIGALIVSTVLFFASRSMVAWRYIALGLALGFLVELFTYYLIVRNRKRGQ
jgi:hypothetical protein